MRPHRLWTVLLCVFLFVFVATACQAPGPGDDRPAASAAIDHDFAGLILGIGAHFETGPIHQDGVVRLYRDRGMRPLWIGPACRPTAAATQALIALHGAPDHGLVPEQYDVGGPVAVASFNENACRPPEIGAAWDIGLTTRLSQYVRDLHQGRVPPETLGFRISGPRDSHDFVALVGAAADMERVPALVERFVPSVPQYRPLQVELTRYRQLAATPDRFGPLPGPARLDPGDPYAGAGRLADRLQAFGDLQPGEATRPADRYGGRLVEAVTRFQGRHGLEPDGIIGPATRAALEVPPADRVRQIELALERLRGLPHLGRARVIEVNIPLFRLWAWDAASDAGPALVMNVIVGRALDTRTPVLGAELQSVVFVPYWNVPTSILRAELLPEIRRDPGYLARENLEIVEGPGDDARPVALDGETLARLGAGRLRVRQRPGPGNALGLVKFVFPNEHDVYMHGTPAQELFGRARRDFSHGCIRLERPAELAAWVLAGQSSWSADDVEAAMRGTTPREVPLAAPIRMLVLYTTAVVTPEDGRLHFAPDIYGHDDALDRALADYRPEG